MARQEAQSKLLYYPTPSSVVDTLATWFTTASQVRLADPCCGTGAALQRFATGLNSTFPVETWGVELSAPRAAEASQVLTKVVPASFYMMRQPSAWPSASAGLIFNNPPYDWSDWIENGHHVRHEFLFVEGATRKIVARGHQVIIIPRSILGNKMLTANEDVERLARHVLGWYESVKIYRFPDGEYESYKQVVVFALNKRPSYAPATKDAITAITTLAAPDAEIPVLESGVGEIVIPAAPAGTLNYKPFGFTELTELAAACKPTEADEYKRATYVRPLDSEFRPAMPLSVGHIAMLLTSQQAGVLQITNDEGKPLLVKGRSAKTKTVDATPSVAEDGKVIENVRIKESFVAEVETLNAEGVIETMGDSESVGAFMLANAERLADAIVGKNKPTYNNNPTHAEWAVTGRSALGLPPLPGRSERGLFPVQRHFAIAAARICRSQKAAILNAEMGFGKTATSITALEVLGEWPALVVAPGHMLWKWFRDLERVSDPESPITARVITRAAIGGELDEQGRVTTTARWPGIKAAIEATGAGVISVRRTQVTPVCSNDTGMRRVVNVRCDTQQAAKIAAFARKSLDFRGADTDENGKIVKKIPLPAKIIMNHAPFPGLTLEYVDRDEYTMFDFAADYRAGLLGKKAVAVASFDVTKYDAGAALRNVLAVGAARYEDASGDSGDMVVGRVYRCPNCGESYYSGNSAPDKCKGEIEEKVLVNDVVETRRRVCGAPLFEMSRWRRIGLAPLLKRKFRHFFRVYVADEIHKAANGSTDIGVADQRLISVTRYSIALTGTLFGGTASTLFNLLYRRVPDVRRDFGFGDSKGWVTAYGLWQEDAKQEAPKENGRGVSTNLRRWDVRVKELPGVSPAVAGYLLPITMFGNLTDLGYSLPPVHENLEILSMTPALAVQMNFLSTVVLRAAAGGSFSGKTGGLSAWFTAMRFRPASAFRHETVAYQDPRPGENDLSYTYELDEVVDDGEFLPKEMRLAEIVKANMALGRKTLVFVEQSGTRDIRDRLSFALQSMPNTSRQPRIGILSAGDMAPARREAWINSNAPALDVMIVNPKLVETGLDLVMFTDIIFYETTVSLSVLWQAMRRVWRLGQKNEVFVTFLAYADTAEEAILQRMGAKKKAAQLLYGKEAGGVLVETDDEDIQREIIRAALAGHKLALPAGESSGIFTDGSERVVAVSVSPVGSLVAISPALNVTNELMQMTLFGEMVAVKAKKRR